MRFKEFVELDEGIFSSLFGKKPDEPFLGPKMLNHGDKKNPAASYGGSYRTQAMKRKLERMRQEAQREKRGY
jgi:hypothetical protein